MMGKTHWCQYYFNDPQKMLVLNCDGSILPDLDVFDRGQGHLGITFDDGTPQLILRHRRVFQCLPYRISVKQGPPEIYNSRIMFSGLRMIVTTNSWSENLQLCTETEKAWLAQNVIVVEVTRPLFREGEFVHASHA